MAESFPQGQPTRYQRTSWWFIVLVLACTVAIDLAAPFIAWRWTRQPFPGVLFEHTLVVGGVHSDSWVADFPKNPSARLIALDDQPVANSRDISQVWQNRSAGDPVALTFEPRDGTANLTIETVLHAFSTSSWVSEFWLPYLVGLVYLAIGVWVFRYRGYERPGQSFALFCAFVALATAMLFDLNTTHVFSRIWTASLPFAAAALLHLGLVFPEEGPPTQRWPLIRFVPYPIAVILALASQVNLYHPTDPWAYITYWRWNYAFLGVSLIIFFALMFYTRARTLSGIVRQQVRIILIGSLLAFAPLAVYMILAGLAVPVTFYTTLYLPPLVIFPLAIAYAILRYRLLGMDLVISRGLAYTILVATVAGAYFLALAVLGQILGINLGGGHPLLLALFVIILVFALNPLRESTEQLADRLLGRQRMDYGQALQAFSRELATTPLDLSAILKRLFAQIEPISHSAPALIFLHESRSGRYTLVEASGFVGSDEQGTCFERNSGLANTLDQQDGPLYLVDAKVQSAASELSAEEQQRIDNLGLVLFLPLREQAQLVGWVALGPRLSGEPYTPDDLAFLSALADQTAIAVGNAQLLIEARHRADELVALQQTALDISARQEIPVLLRSVVERAVRLLGATGGGVLLAEGAPPQDRLRMVVSHNLGQDYTGTVLKRGEGLAGQVLQHGRPVRVENYHRFPGQAEMFADAAANSVLGVPLKWRSQVLGVLDIVDTDPARNFTKEDEWLLMRFASQAAIALRNAQLFADLELRVTQLDALRQIGEAVDLRQELGTLLELIYTQTSRVLDVDNFYVALYDQARQEFQMAYYIREGEKREHPVPVWSLGRGLSSEVIRSREPIVTDDYGAECERRGIVGSGLPVKAWLSVPLLTGPEAQVVGVLNVSTFRHGLAYSEEQVLIMRAIADQAAVAIDRMRLYQEMKDRATELSTLNAISRSISSTLDLRSVLDSIMKRVVELLDVEAGSLLLLDEESGDLVFEVALRGEDQEFLVGRRHPFGEGIVGSVAQMGQAQIINDVQADPRWNQAVDQDTGFVTRGVVCVPMVSRDRVIGVIELINHRDGRPFQESEANLLEAFASQAAIAIENARLYTQTDQALARRVEELSTMQRIDRELNTALDCGRVMDMTVDWAMRMTGAPVGVIAMYDEAQQGLFLLASRGYPAEFERYRTELWPLGTGVVTRVVRSGEATLIPDVSQDPDYRPAQPDTRSQLSVPIRREDQVIGVINLESPEPAAFDEDDLAFIQRLADHAAIAIENARLHAETEKRLQEQVALREAGAVISSALDLDTVLSRIAEQMGRAIDATSAYICVYDPETISSSVVAEYISAAACDEERVSDLGVTYLENEQDFLETLESGEHAYSFIDDPDLPESERKHMKQYGAKTIFYFPLLSRGRLIGYSELWESRQRREFTPDEIALCQGIAQQAAVALENAHLYQESQRRAEDMALLYDISLTVSSHLALQLVLEAIYERIRDVWNPPVFYIALYDQEEDALDFPIYVDRGGKLEPFRQFLTDQPGFSAWIVRNREPILIRDWQKEAGASPVKGIPIGPDITRAWMGVPLIAGERMVGVMSVQDYEPNVFGEEHMRFLSTIASEVAIAIENARLYQETQQRLGELRLLFDTSAAVSKSLDLDHVLHTTAEQITAALMVDGCILSTWDREQDAMVTQLDYTPDPDAWQPEAAGTIYPLENLPASRQVLTERRSLVVQAADPGAEPAALAWMKARDVQSMLMVPLIVRDEAIGLLELVQTQDAREFTSTEMSLCQTLANQAAAALENANLYEGVRQANQAKSEFIDFVAHELKQPMTSMQGYAKMLTMGIAGELNDTQQQFVDTITANVDRMGKLVNDLLEISRLEAGRTKLKLAPVQLKAVVDETVVNTRTEIEARRHTLEVETPEELPLVLGDRERLVQILTNLVSNAYKYTPEGGLIRITVNGQDRPDVPAGHLCVSVSDTGIGLTPKDIANLDEKFYRSDDDLVQQQPGTGLGVSITRNLVELHGGEFMIESEPGRGSTFCFTVPIAE